MVGGYSSVPVGSVVATFVEAGVISVEDSPIVLVFYAPAHVVAISGDDR